MRVDRQIDLLQSQGVLDGEGRLGDEVGGARSDDVRPQQLPRPGVGDDLDETLGLAERQRPTRGGEREAPDLDRDSLFLRLVFAESDVRDLGIGVDAVGRRVIVGDAVRVAGDVLHRAHALV